MFDAIVKIFGYLQQIQSHTNQPLLFKYYLCFTCNATSHQQEVSKIDVTVCNASNSRGVNRTTEVGTQIYKMTRTGQLLQEKHPRLTTNQNCAILWRRYSQFHCTSPKIRACHPRENGLRIWKKKISVNKHGSDASKNNTHTHIQGYQHVWR